MQMFSKDSLSESEIEELLRKEVLDCHAPITGVCVASCIITQENIYFEHNNERENPIFFEHSETRSLENILILEKGPKIQRIILAAGGNANKFKSYIPCFNCTVALSLYTTRDTRVDLLGLPGREQKISTTLGSLIDCYKELPYSKIISSAFLDIRKELLEKTDIVDYDMDFVSDLVLFGKEKGVNIYLTGSSTGRGGAGTLIGNITGDKYRDLDIFVVMKQEELSGFERDLEVLVTKHYRVFTIGSRIVPQYHNTKGVVFKKVNYYCGENKETNLDFTYSMAFHGTLAYHAYEERNWFHQLS